MKIGAELQLAMHNMDRQVDMARRAASELAVSPKEAKEVIEQAEKVDEKEAEGSLGNNVDVEA